MEIPGWNPEICEWAGSMRTPTECGANRYGTHHEYDRQDGQSDPDG
ncbi:MAG: hypothetical protein ACKO3H_04025 [Verrucomicrobiota bacterium]